LSSILRALKRVEKEAPPPDDYHPWPRTIDTKKTITSRVKKKWLYSKLIKLLLIVIIIALAGWLLFSQRQWIAAKIMPEKKTADVRNKSAATKNKDKSFHAKINKPSSQTQKKLPKPPPIPNKQRKKPTYQRGTETPLPNKPIAGNLPQIEQQQGNVQSRPVIKKKPLKKRPQRVQSNQPSGSTAVSNRKPSISASSRNSAKNTTNRRSRSNFDGLKALDDDQLKLQAIAWSDDVARRMVVINNRIIKEGGTVDGFTITEIRQEDVIVNDGNRSWRLEFGLKQ
jgi:hypothetical protein